MTDAAPDATPDAATRRETLKRDSFVMGLVGIAHFTSHFFQLSLPPLFPLLHDVFQVDYVALGSLMTVFFLVSGICQAFAGIIVDHFGARPVLLCGITTMAICIGLCGAVAEFWMFYPLAALAGIGNSVFHPADFSALSSQVSKGRLGRAYSVHALSGTLGYAAAPLVIGTIAYAGHWRLALLVAGSLGLLVAFLVLRFARFISVEHHAHSHAPREKVPYRSLITSSAIILAFIYFLFTSAAGTAVQTFASVSFLHHYPIVLNVATSALSAYLIGTALGMLIGGILADATTHHVYLAVGGLALCATLFCVIATGLLPFPWVMLTIFVAGGCQGAVAPSRDILVKGVTPPGSTGRVFGFVYSGLDAGSTLAPVIFGALADHDAYHTLFAGIAVLFATAIFSVLQLGKRQVKHVPLS
jgi:MFS family permease